MESITPIGNTDWRNQRQPFGIKEKDRMGHIYVIGKTGTGKSTLLENMAILDIEKGNGVAIIDPHGDIAESILSYIPNERIDDVIYFNPKDLAYPIGFNPLSGIDAEYHHLAVSGLISTFKKIWADSWGPRLEYILRFSLLTLLEYPNATLLDIQPLLTDYAFRTNVLSYTNNPHIIAFWKSEFEKYQPGLKAEAISPILNKVGVFVTSTPLRNIIGQARSSFQFEDVINRGKIFVANLSKGEIGEDASSLLGSMLITAIQLATLKRATVKEENRKPFFLYVDEMHSFVSLSFADILSEARKYKLSLFLAHQYLDQLHEKIRTAIFGNVGTVISFRVGAEDAHYLAKEFYPIFKADDFINLPKYSMYIKLMIDGATSKPFSATTLPLPVGSHSSKEEIISASQKRYTRPKESVEKEIFRRNSRVNKDNEQFNLFT